MISEGSASSCVLIPRFSYIQPHNIAYKEVVKKLYFKNNYHIVLNF